MLQQHREGLLASPGPAADTISCSCRKATVWRIQRPVGPALQHDAVAKKLCGQQIGPVSAKLRAAAGDMNPQQDLLCGASALCCPVPIDGELLHMFPKPAAELMHCSEALLIQCWCLLPG